MEVKAVWTAVRINHMNLEAIPGARIDHCAGYAAVIWRLVDISQDNLSV